MDEPITRNAEQWRQLWLQSKARSPVNRREQRGLPAEIERWNQRACSYAEQTETERNRRRRDRVLRWLAEEGCLRREFRVLDIGAGPGSFAASLARTAAEVVALEPVSAMVAILKRRIAVAKITNIQVVPKSWQEIDLAAEGWRGAFDLVFASMTPGVSDPQTLQKMVGASRRFCYLSGWSGAVWGRWGRAQADLWPRLFGEKLGDYPSDVLYAFGLLYALGFRPQARFYHSELDLEMPQAGAVEGLVEHFQRYGEIDAEVRRVIEVYVNERSEKGIFRQEGKACQGFLLWRVDTLER